MLKRDNKWKRAEKDEAETSSFALHIEGCGSTTNTKQQRVPLESGYLDLREHEDEATLT